MRLWSLSIGTAEHSSAHWFRQSRFWCCGCRLCSSFWTVLGNLWVKKIFKGSFLGTFFQLTFKILDIKFFSHLFVDIPVQSSTHVKCSLQTEQVIWLISISRCRLFYNNNEQLFIWFDKLGNRWMGNVANLRISFKSWTIKLKTNKNLKKCLKISGKYFNKSTSKLLLIKFSFLIFE